MSFPLRLKARRAEGGRGGNSARRPARRSFNAGGAQPAPFGYFQKFNVPEQLFCQIISTYDLLDQSRGKPYPDLLENILKAQNVNPDEAIMVGDAEGDVRMARAAGVRPIVVLTGHLSEQQAKELGVKDIIPTVADLELLLD